MPIRIDWKGKTLTISDNEIFQVGEEIEEIITLPELASMGSKPKTFKLARCYSLMINFAGGKSTPVEVHKMMISELSSGDGGDTAREALQTLMQILMDGAPEMEEGDSEIPEG